MRMIGGAREEDGMSKLQLVQKEQSAWGEPIQKSVDSAAFLVQFGEAKMSNWRTSIQSIRREDTSNTFQRSHARPRNDCFTSTRFSTAQVRAGG